MYDGFLGSIVCFAFTYAPTGWLPCDGQALDISTNQALYTLIGIKFGGNGTTNFCLPNLNASARFGGNMRYYIATTGIYPSWNY
jgi:microcystin-dependent protein